MFRTRTAVTALAAAVAAAVIPTATAAADSHDGAMVRVAHFSPDAPAVDVYVDGDAVLTDVAFPAVSDYLNLPAGDYSLEVRPAGAAADSDPVIAADATVDAGQAYTVAAVGVLDDIAAQIYVDDLSAPAAGEAKVRVIHAAPEVPAVDVAVVDGPTLFSGAEFPAATDYAGVAAGSYDVGVMPAGGGDMLLSATVDVAAGSVYTVAAVGGAGEDVRLLPIVDAAGMGEMPSGGVATGGGGAAGVSGAASSAPVLGIAAGIGLLLATALVALRRRPSES